MSLLGDDGKTTQGPASRVLCSLAPCMRVEEGGASWGVMALSLAMSVHWGEPEDESRSERTLFLSLSLSPSLSICLYIFLSLMLVCMWACVYVPSALTTATLSTQ